MIYLSFTFCLPIYLATPVFCHRIVIETVFNEMLMII